jgi:hypothetical protein
LPWDFYICIPHAYHIGCHLDWQLVPALYCSRGYKKKVRRNSNFHQAI